MAMRAGAELQRLWPGRIVADSIVVVLSDAPVLGGGLAVRSDGMAASGMGVALMLAENMVCALLLRRRHAGVESLEGRDELLQPTGMLVGDDLERFQIVDSGHRLQSGRPI